MKTHRIFFFASLFLFMAASCVPLKKHRELEARQQRSEAANERLRVENDVSRVRNENLLRQVENLTSDTTRLGADMRRLRRDHDVLKETHAQILEYNAQLLQGKEEETRQILGRLQEIQVDLQRREDELVRASREMAVKQRDLDSLMTMTMAKEQRVNELEAILNRQDSIVGALRTTVSNALLGFEGRGLSVELRNGKVYVSLDESLLFATGSTVVDARGENALRELAKVLERNPEIDIMIEGHTDDVPIRSGSLMKDNWDLSVLRATSVLRILLKHGNIDPQRFIAAGRGEFVPLDPAKTTEARQKNRRTEIILTPKLDDLFRIIEQNPAID